MRLLRLFTLLGMVFAVSSSMMSIAFAEESSGGVTKEFVELFPEDLQPAFTQSTVLKLNAIVQRSLDAITEYDEIIEDVRIAVEKAVSLKEVPGLKEIAQEKVAMVSALDESAKSALKDMQAAATELRNSDEVYNSALLYGMVDFVEDVEREIAAQHNKLEKMLEAA